MKRFYLFILFFVFVIQAYSQSNYSQNSYLNLSDSLFQFQNYQSASIYYKKALKKAEKPGPIMLRLATCFSKMNQPEESEKWYKEAEKENVQFPKNDIYRYADILIKLQKRAEAEEILIELLNKDPEAAYAKFVIDDLHNNEKYYLDSAEWKIEPLSINTTFSEFAPQYYKDGLVFTSSQPKTFLDKKYHWDGSHFLNLFYSKKTEGVNFDKPELLNKQLNSQYHDGPVAFYNDYEKMILNRNLQVSLGDENNTKISQLSLFDATKVSEKESWKVQDLPFTHPPYSYAHPSISESGNTLYFVSNMEGGFGGTDIYRIERINGKWGEPKNLGPHINTHKNEVFPYFIDGLLYFASDGLGGLGGLDIFQSFIKGSEFSAPVNLGYPINSSSDDFSLVTRENDLSGYFSSSRFGNDDLFAFSHLDVPIELIVQVLDSASNKLIDSADVELITFQDTDQKLLSDQDGRVNFSLMNGSSFLLIGKNGNLSGMYSATVDKRSGSRFMTHELMLTAGMQQQVTVAGVITNSDGYLLDEVIITVKDSLSGDTIDVLINKGIFSFLGEAGNDYRINVEHRDFAFFSDLISIPLDEGGVEKLEIILEESDKQSMIDLLAHVYTVADENPVVGATVELITFIEPDRKQKTDQEGNVSFTLPEETVFLLLGSKDDLSGMYTSIVDGQSGKAHMIHQVPMSTSKESQVPVAGLVTNKDGYMLDEVVIMVTAEDGGESFEVLVKKGVFSFLGEAGNDYRINVEHRDFAFFSDLISIPLDEGGVEKLEIILEESDKQSMTDMLAHVYTAADEKPVVGATVELITFIEPDRKLKTDQEGNVSFTLPEETAFLLLGSKDDLNGMYTSIVDGQSGKAHMIHQVPMSTSKESQVAVAGLVTNKDGYMLDEVVIMVTAEDGEESFEVLVKKGVFSFLGDPGKKYNIHTEQDNSLNGAQLASVTIGENKFEKVEIILEESDKQSMTDMLAHVYTAADEKPVVGATVELITFIEPDRKLKTDQEGNVSFTLPEETAFLLLGSKDDLNGMYTSIVDGQSGKAHMIHQVPMSTSKESQVAVAGLVTNKDGYMLDEVVIMVTAEDGEESFEVLVKKGVFSFLGDPGKKYNIHTEQDNSLNGAQLASVTIGENKFEKVEIILEESDKQSMIDLLAHVYTAADEKPVVGATVELITFIEPDRKLKTDQEGNVSFTLPEETAFLLLGSKDDLNGMYTSIVDGQSGKAHMIHQVPMSTSKESQVAVAGLVTNKDGYMLDEVVIMVTAEDGEESFEVLVKKGVFSFLGDPGKNYYVQFDQIDTELNPNIISIPSEEKEISKIKFTVESEYPDNLITMVTIPQYLDTFSENNDLHESNELSQDLEKDYLTSKGQQTAKGDNLYENIVNEGTTSDDKYGSELNENDSQESNATKTQSDSELAGDADKTNGSLASSIAGSTAATSALVASRSGSDDKSTDSDVNEGIKGNTETDNRQGHTIDKS